MSCGRPPGPHTEPAPPIELARFDFEERGWSTQGVVTEDCAKEGLRACLVSGGLNGASAHSRLIPLGDVEVLEVTWWARIEDLRSPRVRLLLRGFVDAPSPHPAVPALPQRRYSHVLAIYRSDLEDWTSGSSSIVLRKDMRDATHVAFEVSILAPKVEGERVQAGRFYLDDLVVSGRAK